MMTVMIIFLGKLGAWMLEAYVCLAAFTFKNRNIFLNPAADSKWRR